VGLSPTSPRKCVLFLNPWRCDFPEEWRPEWEGFGQLVPYILLVIVIYASSVVERACFVPRTSTLAEIAWLLMLILAPKCFNEEELWILTCIAMHCLITIIMGRFMLECTRSCPRHRLQAHLTGFHLYSIVNPRWSRCEWKNLTIP
jgi:hypothetical protein